MEYDYIKVTTNLEIQPQNWSHILLLRLDVWILRTISWRLGSGSVPTVQSEIIQSERVQSPQFSPIQFSPKKISPKKWTVVHQKLLRKFSCNHDSDSFKHGPYLNQIIKLYKLFVRKKKYLQGVRKWNVFLENVTVAILSNILTWTDAF